MLQLGLGLLQQTVFPAKKAIFTNRPFSLQKRNLSSPFLLATGKSNSAIFGQHQLSNLNYSISFQWISSKKLPKKAKYAFLDGSCSRMLELFLAADSFQVAVSGFRLLHSLGQSTLEQERKSCKLRIDILLIDTLKGWHLFSVCRKTQNDSICIRSC